jgi:hypothetical protein
LPTPDQWQHEVDEALFGTDEAEASPDQLGPASLDFPPTPEAGSWRREDDAGEDLFDEDDLGAAAAPFADPDEGTVVDPEEETIIAELADEPDAAEPTGPRRGRRRVWVLAEYTVLVVIIGATAGALIAGRSGSTRPGRKTVSDHTTATTATTWPVVTTTPVPATTAPAVTAPAPSAPRAPATSRRTAPPPAEPSVEPEPPPPEPPPPEPPPSTSPPSTSPLP